MKKSKKLGPFDPPKVLRMEDENPPAPPTLKQAGAEFWRIVHAQFVVPQDMWSVLESAGIALDRATEAKKILDEEGVITFDRFNQQKIHPAFLVERDSRQLFLRAVKQMGLDMTTIDPKLVALGKARS
jgi:hypothetical protein